ncbi:MAG: hypothetical protein HY688_00515 [Chloroflexi bacterium]|nr:hypothetical protein [Chloroflexota bacterium]
MVLDAAFQSIAGAFAKEPGVTQSKMFGSPGLKVSGKVFAVLVKGKLVVKLPRERGAAIVTSGDGEYFDPGMGRLMKEWVAIGQTARVDWLSLAKEARDFVAAGR